MRFLQSEYNSILHTIQAAGYQESDFSFVKKRGKVHINLFTKNQSFHFFRKTTTVLNDTRQWEKAVFFQYGEDKKETIEVDNWEDVLRAFQKWLKSN